VSRRIFLEIDDAGSDRAGLSAISRILAAGPAVDGVSILAAGPFAAEACELAACSGLSVSVHLNCAEPPFLSCREFPRASSIALAPSRYLPAIEREWRLQIERLTALGAKPSGIDSHRHLHHLPGLAGLSIRLAKEYGIGRMRTAVLPDRLSRFPSGLVLDALGRRLRKLASGAGLESPVAMAGFGAAGRLSREYLERLRLPEGIVELVAHPSAVAIWSPGQPAELDLLTSDWFREWKSGS